MKKFILTSPKFENQVTFGYDVNGDLVFYNNEIPDPAVIKWMKRFLPVDETELEQFKTKIAATITEIPEDLSFDRFWNAYAKKINRLRTEPLYNKLNDADKIKCIIRIHDYKEACFRLKRGVKDPENYIRDRFFDTDWKREK